MTMQSTHKPTAICLMGPTASGKTQVALALAARSNIEIISVDSALVYRGLDIGTGKPDADTLAKVPHHLVDIRDPSTPYSAAEFRRDAIIAMQDITARGKIPLLVGGSMLYFRVLRDGLAKLPEADPIIRDRLTQVAQRDGWPALHRRLAAIDPTAAARIRPGDSQRLQRALEVYEITGKTLTELHTQRHDEALPCSLQFTAIYPKDRSVLHGLIESRLDQMLSAGFVDEVRALYHRADLHPQLPAIRSVGYRQVWNYLAGLYDEETMRYRALVATRQLAKRQLTWLRGWPQLSVMDSETTDLTERYLKIVDSAA